MCRAAIACALLAGCGRLGFDPLGGSGDGGLSDGREGDSAGDAARGSGLLVQQSPVAAGTGAVTVPLPVPTSAGTLLVAVIGATDIAGIVYPSGWQANANGTASGACGSVMATATTAPAGQTSIVFGFGMGVRADVEVSEWTGVGDIDLGGFGGGSTPTTMYSVRTPIADAGTGDVAIATFCENRVVATLTPGSGYSELGAYQDTPPAPLIVAEYATGEPAARITATASATASSVYSAAMLTFHVP